MQGFQHGHAIRHIELVFPPNGAQNGYSGRNNKRESDQFIFVAMLTSEFEAERPPGDVRAERHDKETEDQIPRRRSSPSRVRGAVRG